MANQILPGIVSDLILEKDYAELKTDNGTVLRVHFLSNSVIRFRYSTDYRFDDDFSYAISRQNPYSGVSFEVKEVGENFVFSTQDLHISINRYSLNVSIYNSANQLICADEKGFHWEENYEDGGNYVYMSKFVQEDEHYYGLGDKPVHLNLRGKRLVNWAMDEYGFHRGTDPIYKCIPFYLGSHRNLSYGIFFDNTFRTHFDFASERKSVTSFWADGGEMNYYFFYGPEMLDVTRQYTLLTGTPDLPPMWALGYHQCKWSYYPESVVREVTTKLRDLKIPCDAFYLDIDYMDGFRCFTWDLTKFPDPRGMVSDLKKQGFKTIVIIDPGIKIDEQYGVFREGFDKNYFLRRADGPLVKGKVWPGECYFPDFTNPDVRKWWSDLFEGLIEKDGVAGVWNDMNEPAIFEVPSKTIPNDVRHDFDGHPCSHRKAHNIYGMQMARATRRGVRRYAKPKRPFVITRSVYSGGQRYSSAWTGDNIASWDHLWLAQVQCQRMAMSGYSFVGSDVGGFIEHPTPELYVRWVQTATFHVFFRTHSSGDHGAQEPWSFGEKALNVVRKFIELRYKLLPYLYTAFYQYSTTGIQILRPICVYDQSDNETLYRTDECLHGDHILFCPILEPNAMGRYLYLPKGLWYNYWTDEAMEGKNEYFVEYGLDTSPIFIKAGAVIPMYPIQQYVGEKAFKEITLHIYNIIGEETSLLYEDDGDGYDFEKGIYNEKTFTVKGSKGLLSIKQDSKGHFEPQYNKYKIVIHGIQKAMKSIQINGNVLEKTQIVSKDNLLTFDAKSNFLVIELNY